MARQLQADEPMQNITVRMPAQMVADIDAYRTRLKAQNPAFRVERGEAVRDLVLKGLRSVTADGPAGPGDARGGPVEAPVTLGEAQTPTGQDRGTDRLPMDADQFAQKAAPSQDHTRTTVRTGRKRTAAKG